MTRLSDSVDERSLVSSLQVWWTLPCFIALRCWPGLIHDVWGTYALVTALLSYPYCRELVLFWSIWTPWLIQEC